MRRVLPRRLNQRNSTAVLGALDQLAARAGGGAVLLMTGRFGRSPVREGGYRLRERRRDLDLRPSWRLFASVADWGERWRTEQHTFAAGLILSAAGDPVVERAVGRCLFDLWQLGRPVLWGVLSDRVRWYPRFKLGWNGWPEEWFPHPTATYARLGVAHDGVGFRPQFNPILYSGEPDFFVSNSRLHWVDGGLFDPVTGDG
jgi:hypothetical protein